MTLKNILVPLMGNTQDTIALDAAGKLALRFGAHLEALHISSTGDAALPFLGESTSGAVIDEIISRIEAEAEANAAKAKSVSKVGKKMREYPAANYPAIRRQRSRLRRLQATGTRYWPPGRAVATSSFSVRHRAKTMPASLVMSKSS